jgi:hypothetical protein
MPWVVEQKRRQQENQSATPGIGIGAEQDVTNLLKQPEDFDKSAAIEQT